MVVGMTSVTGSPSNSFCVSPVSLYDRSLSIDLGAHDMDRRTMKPHACLKRAVVGIQPPEGGQ